ncbi:hypothetical protein J6590_083134 [Homalodisca vitripennis]|nr:hypothetical protein J6590_083134 [Homalodisca vitripennis]
MSATPTRLFCCTETSSGDIMSKIKGPRTYGIMSAMFKDRPGSRLVTTKWYLGQAHQTGAVNTFSIIPSYVCF